MLGSKEVANGSTLVGQSHLKKQITEVREGTFELILGGHTNTYTLGVIAVISIMPSVAARPCKQIMKINLNHTNALIISSYTGSNNPDQWQPGQIPLAPLAPTKKLSTNGRKLF